MAEPAFAEGARQLPAGGSAAKFREGDDVGRPATELIGDSGDAHTAPRPDVPGDDAHGGATGRASGGAPPWARRPGPSRAGHSSGRAWRRALPADSACPRTGRRGWARASRAMAAR